MYLMPTRRARRLSGRLRGLGADTTAAERRFNALARMASGSTGSNIIRVGAGGFPIGIPTPKPPIRVVTEPSTPPAASTSTTSSTPAGTPSAGTAPGAQYTDASGNIWTYNGTNWTITGNANAGGQLTEPNPVPVNVTTAAAPVASTYQPLIDFASASSLIPSVPNWIVGLAAVLLVKKLSSAPGRGR